MCMAVCAEACGASTRCQRAFLRASRTARVRCGLRWERNKLKLKFAAAESVQKWCHVQRFPPRRGGGSSEAVTTCDIGQRPPLQYLISPSNPTHTLTVSPLLSLTLSQPAMSARSGYNMNSSGE